MVSHFQRMFDAVSEFSGYGHHANPSGAPHGVAHGGRENAGPGAVPLGIERSTRLNRQRRLGAVQDAAHRWNKTERASDVHLRHAESAIRRGLAWTRRRVRREATAGRRRKCPYPDWQQSIHDTGPPPAA